MQIEVSGDASLAGEMMGGMMGGMGAVAMAGAEVAMAGAQVAASIASNMQITVDPIYGKPLMRWDKHGNKIAVRTDKAFYNPGDVITGTVDVFANMPIECKGVMLKMTGFEKAEWEEEHSRFEGPDDDRRTVHYIKEFKGKKDFFKEKICVSQALTFLAPGRYAYPFSYQLPAGLPGSFHEKRKHKAFEHTEHKKGEIVYKLKACLDCMFAKDLKAKQYLTIHEALDGAIQPAFGEKTAQVRLCCVIPRGQVTLKAWFDKNAYTTGETAEIKAEIKNDSATDIKHMVVKLMRFITFEDKHGHRHVMTDTVHQEEYKGVDSGKHKTRDLPLSFKGDFVPTTNGKFVHCNYRFDVECDIPYAPDIEVHMPVRLYLQPPQVWGIPVQW
eukprot:TRINITY_DN3436_c0_g4_i1.p1 TRINITY_DN3436_c0_g4~~TRINITY_DN3436_c0_g4_i1.p1  ORF type:complete len:385 (-),score=116.18 TRINITY_DN3436_c0_g4_i1:207-1361(-)